MESRETSADFHNAILEFNCYLRSIENGLLHSRTSFVLFSRVKIEIYAKFLCKCNRQNYGARCDRNVEHISNATNHFSAYVKPFCIWNELISDFSFDSIQIEMTSHIHSFNICTHRILIHSKKVISSQFNSLTSHLLF